MNNFNQMAVSVIIAAYNEKEVINECIDSILNCKYPKEKYEIIIVNDGSSDDTKEVVSDYTKKYQNVTTINKDNGGKASAINMGLKSAKGEYILITDAECIVDPNWVNELFFCVKGNPNCVTFGPCYNLVEDSILDRAQSALAIVRFKYQKLRKNFAVGGNMGFNKSSIKKVGNFDESIISTTADFVKRVRKAGGSVLFDPNAIVYGRYAPNLIEFLKQKLRWRESSLRYLKGEKITFSELLGLGYSDGLSLILFVSLLVSIFLLNYRYFLFSFIGVFLISFLLYAKPFLKMCNSKDRHYAKYFLGYLLLEMIIRMILIPYLAYRLIKPRSKPTFESDRG